MSEIPKYYNRGGIIGWDAIKAWGLGYELGCALKYIMRAGHKTPDPREDLLKAIHCLEHYVANWKEPKEFDEESLNKLVFCESCGKKVQQGTEHWKCYDCTVRAVCKINGCGAQRELEREYCNNHGTPLKIPAIKFQCPVGGCPNGALEPGAYCDHHKFYES